MSSYPDNWKDIAQQIKDEAGWRCVRCGHPHESPKQRLPCDDRCDLDRHIEVPSKMFREAYRALARPGEYWPHQRQRVLTVHHLDGDKANCEWWNLAALCQVCHLQIQARVVMERIYMFEHSTWFKPYVAGRYAAEMEMALGKEEVYQRADEIISKYMGQFVGKNGKPDGAKLSRPLPE